LSAGSSGVSATEAGGAVVTPISAEEVQVDFRLDDIGGQPGMPLRLLDDRQTYNLASGFVVSDLVQMSVLAFFTLFIFGVLVDRRILRRIDRLASQVNEVIAGDRCSDIAVDGNDEIHDLAKDVCDMVHLLDSTQANLVQLNADLEDRVQERTENLRATNEQLALKIRELADAYESLSVANATRQRFLVNVSHELRTPLNAIIGFSTVLSKGMSGELSDERLAQVSIIKRSGEHLLALINDILDLSAVESNRVDIRKEHFDLVEVLAETSAMMKESARQKSLELAIELEDCDCQTRVFSDRQRIRQILLNLTDNAIKATESGRITLGLRCATEGRYSLYVSDTGPGISRDDQDSIFDPFVQVHQPEGTKPRGTGLGLTISRAYARLLDGEIDVESEPGKGSTFSVYLPSLN